MGAVGGEVLELIAPPPTTDNEEEAVDRIYEVTMEQAYSVSTDAGDDAASTSIIVEPDYVVLETNGGPSTDQGISDRPRP